MSYIYDLQSEAERRQDLVLAGEDYDGFEPWVILGLLKEIRVLFMLAITHDADKPQCPCVACIGLRELRARP